MTTPDMNRLLQTCTNLDPNCRDFLDDSQCTPEQKARVAAISQYIHGELNDIRRELLEFIAHTEVNKSLDR